MFGRAWAIGIGVISNLPLTIVSLIAVSRTGCEGQPRHPDWTALLGILIAGLLFVVGYAPYFYLSRRAASPGLLARAWCILWPLLTGAGSLFLAACMTVVASGVLC